MRKLSTEQKIEILNTKLNIILVLQTPLIVGVVLKLLGA